MSIDPNQKAIDDGAPCINLGGVKYPIPVLGIKQNRTVVPIIMKITEKFQGLTNVLSALDSETFSDLCNLVYAAINRAHPSMTKNEFEEMPIKTMELVESIAVLMEQTGMLMTTTDVSQKKMEASPTGTP
jgi:hypothetical protein